MWTASSLRMAFVAAALGGPLLAVACAGEIRPDDDGAGDAEPTRDTVRVAVAASFASVQERLADRFTAATGHPVRASVGSSGLLFAQILNGAPFDLFLSADRERPARLEERGLVAPGSRFTYAEGRLALYGPGLDSVRADARDLRGGRFQRLAIANPRLAPYGEAARQSLGRLDLWEPLSDRVVRAENVGQAFQFVESGAAELGFVALAQVADRPEGSYWIVPAELHDPIRQDAVLLREAAVRPGARAYLDFLRSEPARRLIERHGYATFSADSPASPPWSP